MYWCAAWPEKLKKSPQQTTHFIMLRLRESNILKNVDHYLLHVGTTYSSYLQLILISIDFFFLVFFLYNFLHCVETLILALKRSNNVIVANVSPVDAVHWHQAKIGKLISKKWMHHDREGIGEKASPSCFFISRNQTKPKPNVTPRHVKRTMPRISFTLDQVFFTSE